MSAVSRGARTGHFETLKSKRRLPTILAADCLLGAVNQQCVKVPNSRMLKQDTRSTSLPSSVLDGQPDKQDRWARARAATRAVAPGPGRTGSLAPIARMAPEQCQGRKAQPRGYARRPRSATSRAERMRSPPARL